MRFILLAAWVVLACHPAPAQTTFDVVSITPSPTARRGGEGSGREHISWTPTSVTLENASLTMLIEWAYDVKSYQVSGPGWTSEERYDVRAKNQNPAAIEELRRMLRTLLANRFRLTLHSEPKSMPVFELMAAPDGPKLQPAKADESTAVRIANSRFVLEATSMAQFAAWLSGLAVIDRPVLDRTGVAGAFDFSLPAIPYPAPEGVDPGWIFPMLREQLGLVLKPARQPIEVLIIDHADRPSPD